MSAMPFARFTHSRPRSLKTLASAAPPESSYAHRVPPPCKCLGGERHRPVGLGEAVAAVTLARLGLDVTLGHARGEGDRVLHLLNQLAELALVLRARFGDEGAPFRNDVRRRAALRSCRRWRSSPRRRGPAETRRWRGPQPRLPTCRRPDACPSERRARGTSPRATASTARRGSRRRSAPPGRRHTRFGPADGCGRTRSPQRAPPPPSV